eukprot:TCALIF_13357-PA protein Name:"Similar to pol Pro-Pol polyprotein (Simian foamy virus type 1)" AED:0.09 eAED:0.09 QI:0/-1/0/1/-1/1/1/0/211
MTDITAASCARALVRGWVQHHGVPEDITTERGAQFTSLLWSEVGKVLGVKMRVFTSYHPLANRMIERLHRCLKASLKARLDGSPAWMKELPFVMLGLRSAWLEGAGLSAAEMVYGAPLRLPGKCFEPTPRTADVAAELAFARDLRARLRHVVPPPAEFHGIPPVHVPSELDDAQFVYVRNDAHRGPLQNPYDGPFRVISRFPKFFYLGFGR